MGCGRRTIAMVLAGVLAGVAPGSPAQETRSGHQAGGVSAAGRQRALEALDRLSFGPRPGEVDAVARMGVGRWIEEQLHPEAIDDSALEQRLTEYRAASLDAHTLMVDFPPNNLVRQALRGKLEPPAGEPEHAVWESQMALMREREQARGQAAQGGMNAGMQPGARQPAPEAAALGRQLAAMPAEARYAKILSLEPGELAGAVRGMPGQERTELLDGLTPEERETVVALVSPRMVVVNETEDVRLLSDIYSRRELERVMTEFWLNHFNIAAGKNEQEAWYLGAFARQAVAPHALGRFEDLLDAVAESPAMLMYLDNQESVGPHSLVALRREHPGATRQEMETLMQGAAGPNTGQNTGPNAGQGVAANPKGKAAPGINENYGRELMELHTVGVTGGYTQQDVIEAAKVLTGWTVAPFEQGGGFRFEENRHEPGVKTVMGHRIGGGPGDGGQAEGLELLHLLATSPATAHFLSRELAVRFVSDHPSEALVERMARTYESTGGDVAAVLKTMTEAREFWSSAGDKIRTPMDYVVAAARATDAEVTQPYRLVSELQAMGMPLTGTQEPNGYAMTNNAWTSTSELVERMNFAVALTADRIPGVRVPVTDLAGLTGGSTAGGETPQQEETALERAILDEPATPALRQVLAASLRDTAADARSAATLKLAGYSGGDPFAAGLARAQIRGQAGSQVRSQPGGNDEAAERAAVMAGLLVGSPQFQRR